MQTIDSEAYAAPGILRVDSQELDQIDLKREAWMIIVPHVASLPTGTTDDPSTSILAVIVQGDPRVRWFYTMQPIAPVLERLASENLIDIRKELAPRTTKHAMLYTFVREEFTSTITIPHAQDFLNAEKITDYCPTMDDPDNAIGRLEANEWLHFNTPKPDEGLASTSKEEGVQPSDDRYLLHLHEAERMLAEMARLKCAEYLFLKRNFFRAFFEEVYRSDAKVVPSEDGDDDDSGAANPPAQSAASPAPSGVAGARHDTPATGTPALASRSRRGRGRPGRGKPRSVRTERAHQMWLEGLYGVKVTQARILVTGWRELGFLEECKFAAWIQGGGMVAP